MTIGIGVVAAVPRGLLALSTVGDQEKVSIKRLQAADQRADGSQVYRGQSRSIAPARLPPLREEAGCLMLPTTTARERERS
ncbi:MAG: hypothetical protein QOI13_2056 [Paraburkholderia sp.]|nr:hypothetical protein [Paraburkholderia sp.]